MRMVASTVSTPPIRGTLSMVRNSPIEESALVCATMPGSDMAAHTPVPPTTHVHTMHTAAGTNTTPSRS